MLRPSSVLDSFAILWSRTLPDAHTAPHTGVAAVTPQMSSFCSLASRPTRCFRWSGQVQVSTRVASRREARFEGDSGVLWCEAAQGRLAQVSSIHDTQSAFTYLHDMKLVELGATIRRTRLASGISQAQMARMAGVPPSVPMHSCASFPRSA